MPWPSQPGQRLFCLLSTGESSHGQRGGPITCESGVVRVGGGVADAKGPSYVDMKVWLGLHWQVGYWVESQSWGSSPWAVPWPLALGLGWRGPGMGIISAEVPTKGFSSLLWLLSFLYKWRLYLVIQPELHTSWSVIVTLWLILLISLQKQVLTISLDLLIWKIEFRKVLDNPSWIKPHLWQILGHWKWSTWSIQFIFFGGVLELIFFKTVYY